LPHNMRLQKCPWNISRIFSLKKEGEQVYYSRLLRAALEDARQRILKSIITGHRAWLHLAIIEITQRGEHHEKNFLRE
jgi:hypothetical protein